MPSFKQEFEKVHNATVLDVFWTENYKKNANHSLTQLNDKAVLFSLKVFSIR